MLIRAHTKVFICCFSSSSMEMLCQAFHQINELYRAHYWLYLGQYRYWPIKLSYRALFAQKRALMCHKIADCGTIFLDSCYWQLIATDRLFSAICRAVLQIYSQQAGWVKRDEHSLLKTAVFSYQSCKLFFNKQMQMHLLQIQRSCILIRQLFRAI